MAAIVIIVRFMKPFCLTLHNSSKLTELIDILSSP